MAQDISASQMGEAFITLDAGPLCFFSFQTSMIQWAKVTIAAQ
jgi:hypothetical protein